MDIHPTAIVMDGAQIGEGTSIGAFSTIGSTARIGTNCVIGSHCELAVEAGVLDSGDLVIGDGAIIRSGTIIYQNSNFGTGLRTGHRATMREGINAGDGLQVGTLCDIQGHCTIGDHVRFHSNVHIGQKSQIGNFVWIFPYVVLTNDPHPPSDRIVGCTIEDFAIVATMSTVLPGVTIGSGSLVGAMTLVRSDVPAEKICVGVPGQILGDTSKIRFKDTGMPVYPWRRHFHRGYPEAVIRKWEAEFSGQDAEEIG